MTEASPERQLRYLQLDELRFDPENPRLPTHHQGATETVAIEWLLDRANLLELMRSIGQQDFFAGEPILVTPDGDGFKVLEGNRRFGACLLLNHPEKAMTKSRAVHTAAEEAEFRPSRLPALVFDNEADVLGMLGYRHITGIQEWGPLAKARYLRRLWDSSDGPDDYFARLRFIARKIGSKSDYVARLMTALALFDTVAESDFYQIDGLNEESLSFSLFVLAMNRPGIAHFIGLEDGQDFGLEGLREADLEQLTRWLFEKVDERATVLQESRNMSQLVDVIQHPAALAALRQPGTTLAEAARSISSESDSLGARLTDALAEITKAAEFANADKVLATREDIQVLDTITVRCAALRTMLLAAIA